MRCAPLMAGPYLPTTLNGEIWSWRRKPDGTPAGTAWYEVGGPDTAGYYPGSNAALSVLPGAAADDGFGAQGRCNQWLHGAA